MFSSKKIHFQISERKVLLHIFDAVFILTALYVLSLFLELQYLKFSAPYFYRQFVLMFYIYMFGSIFEMYNLQIASNQFQVLKSTVFTVTTTSKTANLHYCILFSGTFSTVALEIPVCVFSCLAQICPKCCFDL
jgi:hypothetical protein